MPTYDRGRKLWVLLYNVGSDNEGIYTRWENGRNRVVAFVQEDDAIRYAAMLEAQDFPYPQVEALAQDELEAFCQEAGLETIVVEPDELLLPLEHNMAETEWQAEGTPTATAEDLSDTELARIRQQLENLL
ncbi:MAG: DUF3110 domain-containing protein [Pseudanabaenaceae cyanobacterium]